MRSETRTLGRLTLLVDCYNANPQSLRAALELLAGFPAGGPRVAVLGSMLELGERSGPLHRELLAEALERPLELVVATGLFAEAARELGAGGGGRPELAPFRELPEAEAFLLQRLEGGEVVLVKGSRGAAMERLLPGLEARFGGDTAEPRGGGS